MSRDWLLVSVAAPPRGRGLLLVDALRRVGARSVERDGDRVLALFAPPAGAAQSAGSMVDNLVAEARAAVRASTGVDLELAWRWLSQAEWLERRDHDAVPRRVGRRLVVAQAGTDPKGQRADDIVIRLEPGVAFGTAEHATTRACLELMEPRVRPGDRVLDVGAGSGVLAVAAALLGARRVLGIEADPVSCGVARGNAALNGVADQVRVQCLEARARDLRKLGRYDGVVVNIEAGVSLPLVPGLPRAMTRDGWLILSGIVGDEAEEARAAAATHGLVLVEERRDRAWWTGLLARPGA